MTKQISIFELLQILKKRIKLIFIICLLIVGVSSGYGLWQNEKEYISTINIIVGEEKIKQTDAINPETFAPIYETKIEYGNHTIPNQTLSFYNTIIKSEDVLTQVRDNLNLEISLEELKDSVLIKTKGESSILDIEVKGINLTNSDEVVDEISEVFMTEAFKITEIDNMKKLTSLEEPIIKNTHNVVRIAFTSFVFSLIIGVMIILGIEVTNNKTELIDENQLN